MKSKKKILFIEFLVIFSFMALLIGVGFLFINQKKADGGAVTYYSVTAMADGGTFIPDSSGSTFSNGWGLSTDGKSAYIRLTSLSPKFKFYLNNVPNLKPPAYANIISGWKDSSGNMVYSFEGASTVALSGTSVTIYPVWVYKACKVTLDKNDGSGGFGQISFYLNSGFPSNITVPERTGYTFQGYKAPDGDGYIYNSYGNLTSTSWSDKGWYYQASYTITAEWTQETYNVKFIGNGGTINSSSEKSQPLKYNESVYITADRPGYQFKYFTQEQNPSSSSTKYYLSGNQFQVTTDLGYNGKEVSMYAQWEAETYNIKFIGNGGKVNSGPEDTHQVSFDESVTIVVDRPGYDFNYFTNEKSPTADSEKYPLSGNQFKVTTDFGDNGVEVPMYAQWTAKQYSIKFSANGKTLTEGTSLPSSVTLNYDDTGGTYQISSNVLKTQGYEFNGWENKANGKKYQPGQQVAIKDLFNISTQSGVYNISNITLTAEWTPITYKIKFDPNTKDIRNEKLFTTPTGSPTIQGLTPSNGMYTLTYDKWYYRLDNFVCNGYNLLGYRTNADATGKLYRGNDITISENLTDVKDQELTLYAQWEPTWSKFAHKESAKPVQQGSTYLIQSAENLGWLMGTISFGSFELRNSINTTKYTIKQTRNIYLTDYPWSPDGDFESNYDGNGCYIYDLHTETEENKGGIFSPISAGLFASARGAIIQKVTIMSGNIVGDMEAGSIVGDASNTLIKNCVNYANVTGGWDAGGIVGYKTDLSDRNASATMSNCFNYGKVTFGGFVGNISAGGIVGRIENGIIKNCYAKANITYDPFDTANSSYGGIAGRATTVTIEQCAFIGNINKTKARYSNGIIGQKASGGVKDCLVRTSTTGLTLFPEYSKNCIVYVNNGSPQTTAEMDYTNWTTINGQWFPKGLTWLA